MELRLPGPNAAALCERITDGLRDAEFAIPGQIVADVCPQRPPHRNGDGSISLFLEALTILE